MSKALLILFAAALATGAAAGAARAAATHIAMDECNVLAADCSTFELVNDGLIVEASVKNGEWSLRCHGKLPAGAPLPSKGAVACTPENTPGMPCETVFGSTFDWQEIISPSGHVSVTCHGSSK